MNQQLTPVFIMDNVYHRNKKLNVYFVPAIYFLSFCKIRQLEKCYILLEHRAAIEGTRNSSVEIATWLRAGEVSKRGSIPGRGNRTFLSSKMSRWFWGLPRLSFGEYRWAFPRKSSRSVKLVPRLWMSAATAPLLYKPSWRARGQIYLSQSRSWEKKKVAVSGKGLVPGEGLDVRSLYLDRERCCYPL
jgi:hypothetical protein